MSTNESAADHCVTRLYDLSDHWVVQIDMTGRGTTPWRVTLTSRTSGDMHEAFGATLESAVARAHAGETRKAG